MMRDEIQPLIKYIVVGNGEAINFWYDHWHPCPSTSIFLKIFRITLAFADLPLYLDLYRVESGNGLRERRTAEVEKTYARNTSFIPCQSSSDEVYWFASGSGKFTLKSVMTKLRNVGDKVQL